MNSIDEFLVETVTFPSSGAASKGSLVRAVPLSSFTCACIYHSVVPCLRALHKAAPSTLHLSDSHFHSFVHSSWKLDCNAGPVPVTCYLWWILNIVYLQTFKTGYRTLQVIRHWILQKNRIRALENGVVFIALLFASFIFGGYLRKVSKTKEVLVLYHLLLSKLKVGEYTWPGRSVSW